MPTEATAAVTPPSANAATPAPAAAPKSGISAQRGKTFAELMDQHGGFSADDESSDAPADDESTDESAKAKPAKEKKPKAKAKAAPAKPAAKEPAEKAAKPANDDGNKQAEPADENTKLTQLKALAKDLGLEVDTSHVTHSDYKKMRLWKDRQVDQLKQREARMQEQERQLMQQIREAKDEAEKHITSNSERLTKAEKILAAYDAGDADGLAQALGKKDWNEVQDDIIAKNSDPNYKKMRELERWKQEQEEREKRAEEEATRAEVEAQERAKQESRQRAREKYRSDLAAGMKESKDRVVREMADDPIFVNTIFMIQEDNYDPSTRRTVTPEQALRMTVNGGNSAVIEALKEQRARLNRALEELDAPPAEPVKPNTNKLGAKPRPKSAPVSPAEKETSPPAKVKLKSPQWKQYARERLADAIDNDRRAAARSHGDTDE